MKKNTHPKYQEVLFVDSSTGQKMVIGSTLQTKETEKHEGKEYPLCRVSVSSSSHPFFTGSKGLVDAEGRIDKFNKRYAAPVKSAPVKEEGHDAKDQGKKKKQPEAKAAAPKAAKEPVAKAAVKEPEAKAAKAKKEPETKAPKTAKKK